ncbi:MAG TPA: helix-turn-helix transcriptional regulator, partial [Mycobacterium sp.]
GYAGRAVRRLEELSTLTRTSDADAARLLLANNYANLLAVVDRLDEAADQVSMGTAQARRERNAMALDIWAAIDGMVHLSAGRLTAARAAVESLPPPRPTGATELDMMRMVVLAQVALRTGDRNLLQQMVSYAGSAYSAGSAMVRRAAAYVLALAAWDRGDLHDAMSGLGGEITPYGSPQTIDQLILSARVAVSAGDAGLRARVLQGCDLLNREHPPIPLFTAVAKHARAILESDATALVAAAESLRSSSRPLLYAAAAEDAGAQLIRTDRRDEALIQLNGAFDAYTHHEAFADARRVGRELRRLGVDRRTVSQPRAKTGWDSLTDAELKVANLVAQGLSNRAVADQLHLSQHTVKTHVHNAFAKLGISSRAQLAELMS